MDRQVGVCIFVCVFCVFSSFDTAGGTNFKRKYLVKKRIRGVVIQHLSDLLILGG